ncbi:hypothetical protein BU17DRAFT_88069 [Hysterangium stoloniferum]|nr:hypothetical protein BU17DRAFT_88069 [Hysterangium stoloniferum]
MSHAPPNAQARQKALHLSTARLVLTKARQHIKGFMHKRAHSRAKAETETETCAVATPSSHHIAGAGAAASPLSFLLPRHGRSDAATLPPSGDMSAHEFARLFATAERDVAAPRNAGCAAPVAHGKRRIAPAEEGDDVGDAFACSPHPLKRLRRDYSATDTESEMELDDLVPRIRVLTGGASVAVAPRPPSSIPSAQSRWQSPHTSPLGPKTSKYVRRSRSGYFPVAPSKAAPNLPVKCLLHEFQKDNRSRDPLVQHPQWCDDLFVSALQPYLHPGYKCNHRYHPCDPEYYEDQCQSDIGLSDDEDDEDDYDSLSTPEEAEEDAKMHVAIHSTEERHPRPDTIKVDRETYPWAKWQESVGAIQNMASPWGMEEIDGTDVAIAMAIST